MLCWIVYTVLCLIIIKLYNILTSGKCYSDALLNGKVVIVIGSADGIAYATALELAKRGAKLILGWRDDMKGRNAVANIIRHTGNSNVTCIDLNLKSLTSVREFVDSFKRREIKLDILINSVEDIRRCGADRTEDGLIECMQVDYFAQYLLTVLLVPLLKISEPSRVVIVSSDLHRYGSIKDLNGPTNSFRAYCNSTLCNLLFSKELSRRLEGTGVAVNGLHPGYVYTIDNSTILTKIRSFILSIFFKNPTDGAQTCIHLAVSDDCDQVTGKYYSDCAESVTRVKGNDEKLAAELWSLSEDLVKLRPEEYI